ncbi:hypothetical protein Tco_0890652 [Tanacetum coccineum]|uniref:Uncharacterized protein n=1 Tax=Tanacetum coccineum TaxID=301880 RepID=A0ABQ5C0N7_9ASTR
MACLSGVGNHFRRRRLLEVVLSEKKSYAPPSPDYVLGPEHPPSLDFVPKPVYPEFMPPEDEVLPAEEQPLPAAVSPIVDSPGYIADSDPKEDPADYPANGGDDDDHESSDDDEDDDDDVEMSIGDQPPTPFWSEAEIARLFAIPSPLSPLLSPLPQIPSPPLPVSSPVTP